MLSWIMSGVFRCFVTQDDGGFTDIVVTLCLCVKTIGGHFIKYIHIAKYYGIAE